MEELREAAAAYYKNGSKEAQNLAYEFYLAMDSNGDGKVSLEEYLDFLKLSGYSWIEPKFFNEIDSNHDGYLDFWEFLTLYYVIKTRTLYCLKCHKRLNGLYFTCVTCFNQPGCYTYDVCCACYGERKFKHDHREFVDNYVLLQFKRLSSWPAPYPASYPASTSQGTYTCPYQPNPPSPARQSSLSKVANAFRALEAAFSVGVYAHTMGCTVM